MAGQLNYGRIAVRHRMSAETLAEELVKLRGFSIVVPLREVPQVISEDPGDNMVLATAVAGDPDYIVSGDDHLRRLGSHGGIQILCPAAFLVPLGA